MDESISDTGDEYLPEPQIQAKRLRRPLWTGYASKRGELE